MDGRPDVDLLDQFAERPCNARSIGVVERHYDPPAFVGNLAAQVQHIAGDPSVLVGVVEVVVETPCKIQLGVVGVPPARHD